MVCAAGGSVDVDGCDKRCDFSWTEGFEDKRVAGAPLLAVFARSGDFSPNP